MANAQEILDSIKAKCKKLKFRWNWTCESILYQIWVFFGEEYNA